MINTLEYLKTIACIVLLLFVASTAQEGGAGDQWGGVTDVFDFPVGARAMAMGGAQVSVADDAFSLYWNPASLEMVPAMSLGAYHTNLPMGTQYSYLSFTYPTLSTGTFSIGVLRLATGDVELRDSNASYLGSEDYGRSLYMFGYGKKLASWFSIGANLKIEHMRIPGYQDEANAVNMYSESSVGGDVGILLVSGAQSGFFRNWRIGVNAHNIVQRSLQFDEEREFSPRLYRFGLSRPFFMNEENNYLHAAFEYDVHENQHVPDYLHFGLEYCFNETFLLRLGWNRRGNYTEGYGTTYGFGIRQFGIQLDYSYWGGRDAFDSSHRISATLALGKTRNERIAEIQEREMQRIQEEAIQQRNKERRETIYSRYRAPVSIMKKVIIRAPTAPSAKCWPMMKPVMRPNLKRRGNWRKRSPRPLIRNASRNWKMKLNASRLIRNANIMSVWSSNIMSRHSRFMNRDSTMRPSKNAMRH
ncbi:MAG: PorV/PorQ family protein [candidate division KSB1 bacterium]|nr:PorV/PorQ family protein [candidate division KSB1 bacterium]